MTKKTVESQDNPTFITTLAGCFAVFTICYAVFHLVTDYLGITFDKKSPVFLALFFFSYLVINVISWPIVKKYLR